MTSSRKKGSIQPTFPCGSLGWKSVCTLFNGSALKTNLQNNISPERFNNWLTFYSAQAPQLHLPYHSLCVSGPLPLEHFPFSPCEEQLWSETHSIIIEMILPLKRQLVDLAEFPMASSYQHFQWLIVVPWLLIRFHNLKSPLPAGLIAML